MRRILSVSLAGVVLVALALISQSASASPKDAKPDPVGELKSTIKKSTGLLKDKKFKEFIELMMPPDELANLNKSGHLNDVVDSMNQNPDKLNAIIKVFEALADKEPKMNEENTEATFETPMIEGGPPDKEIQFQKIKDRWYAKTQRRAPKQ